MSPKLQRMPTLLHISDLHRDSGSKITTAALLESLRRDRARYETDEGLPAPDIAIVTGDIVYGVLGDDANGDTELARQYEEAAAFLDQLADLFFGGDREKIVLLPGNHDISHPHVLRSTSTASLPSNMDQRAVLAKQLGDDGSPWRWVWPEFALRQITDRKLYDARLAPFSTFYETFYQRKRTFSLQVEDQVCVHPFPALGIVVVALSSCWENDLFSRTGRIHPDCVAAATRAVAPYVKQAMAPVAVWHHNLYGGPGDSDYVDVDVLQSLMDGGFVIGLHGHQHRPQFIQHRFTADGKRGMSVISSGTLCGGPNSLPTGRMRGYNVVHLDVEGRQGTLHVRDMKNGSFSLPVWGAAYVPEFAGSSISFELKISTRTTSPLNAASEAEQLLRQGDSARALEILKPHMKDAIVRRVALQVFIETDNWPGIAAHFGEPGSSTEIVALCEALYQTGDRVTLERLLVSDPVKESQDASVRQAIQIARARLGGNS